MGVAAPIVSGVTKVVKETAQEVSNSKLPVVKTLGKPVEKLADGARKDLTKIASDLDKPFISLYEELKLIKEPPKPPPPPEPGLPQQQEDSPILSNRKFKEPKNEAKKVNRRTSGLEASPLGSILLAPSVLGTQRSVLAENKGTLA